MRAVEDKQTIFLAWAYHRVIDSDAQIWSGDFCVRNLLFNTCIYQYGSWLSCIPYVLNLWFPVSLSPADNSQASSPWKRWMSSVWCRRALLTWWKLSYAVSWSTCIHFVQSLGRHSRRKMRYGELSAMSRLCLVLWPVLHQRPLHNKYVDFGFSERIALRAFISEKFGDNFTSG